MTIENITRYLTKGDLLIVGDREDIQLLALEHNNAILVTGGFQVSDRVKELSRLKQFPVMVTTYDTFTVATMINQALRMSVSNRHQNCSSSLYQTRRLPTT